ncbi:MAG: arginine--tRNA ligase [Patescibacteria group bacterium]
MKEYILEKIKLDIVKVINQALKKKIVKASDLVYPPDLKMGDLSLPCFQLAKVIKKSPAEAASWLLTKLKFKSSGFSSIKVIGPYLNFTINNEFLGSDLFKMIDKEKDQYGKNKNGGKERVMIEYSNANTHKEYHIGHLRNICFGDAVNKILAANGNETVPVSYINDFGIHVAKTIWAYSEFFKDKKINNNKGYFLGQVYARAIKELEKSKTGNEMVKFIMKKIESRQGNEYQLWQKTREWSIKQFNEIYQELGIKFTKIFYESEFIGDGLKMVDKLLKKGVLEKSQGAVIANLEKYNLGVLMFLRSDGTAMYPVADLPLALEKVKKYKLAKSIYVVDIRQSLNFKQLFKVLELIGQKEKFIHLSYEFVKLPSGMMSSRTGEIITYQQLSKEIIKKAIKETKKRHKDWRENKVSEVAKAIAIGAIKFEMVKVNANQVITFDINKALQFEGYTAAYLQYTYARVRSIFRKLGNKEHRTRNITTKNLLENKEHEMVLKLAMFPEIVEKAGENYDPSEIAKYLFDLAQMFNDYYHRVSVLKTKEEIRDARLVLINAVSQVLKNGLELLGIETVDEM